MVRKLHETDINQIFPFSWIWEFFAAVEKNKCFSTAYLCMFRFLHQQQNGCSINILNIAPTPSSMEESLFHVPLNSFLWRVAVLIVISFSCLFTSAVHPSFFFFSFFRKKSHYFHFPILSVLFTVKIIELRILGLRILGWESYCSMIQCSVVLSPE